MGTFEEAPRKRKNTRQMGEGPWANFFFRPDPPPPCGAGGSPSQQIRYLPTVCKLLIRLLILFCVASLLRWRAVRALVCALHVGEDFACEITGAGLSPPARFHFLRNSLNNLSFCASFTLGQHLL